MSETWHDVKWAAAYLGVSEKTVRRYAAKLGAVRFGGQLRFRASQIDSFLERRSLTGRGKARGAA